MSNYDGIRITPRTTNYIVVIDEQFYYYDCTFTLRGPYETNELATEALKLAWEKYNEQVQQEG